MDISQSTQRGIINWNTFNVGAAAQVSFKQPSADSVTLNRVQDSNPSQIFGRISANGQVFLTNPNGVYFGPGSSVDAGGLVATTHSISDADFLAGKTTFSRNGATGSVINEGQLKAALGGYIALLAPEVRNNGIIIAQMGTAVLASGEAFSLNFGGNNTLAGITVQPSQIKALVENKQAVLAPGGLIILSAQAANSLQGGVVRNSGRLEANGLSMKGGRIVLEASSLVDNSGTIRADSAGIASDGGVLGGGLAGSVAINAPQIINSGVISAINTPSFLPVAAGNIVLTANRIVQTATGHIDASGATPEGAGSVSLIAQSDISLAGSIEAKDTSPGMNGIAGSAGNAGISVVAAGNITLDHAVLDASGGAGGGRIHIEGGKSLPDLPPVKTPIVLFLGNTVVNVASRRGNGGSVTVTGDYIGLLDNMRIDASGAMGGGTIHIGGGWQGGGGITPAIADYVSKAVILDASATDSGNGGEITVWSDVHNANSATRVYGVLLAKGGTNGGDGGRIETSGHWLDVSGMTADASAAKGQGGEWLLDPWNLTIAGVATTATPVIGALGTLSSFSSGTGATNVLNTDIQNELNLGTSVTLQTTGANGDGFGNGDINVNANIAKTSGGTATLLLKAHNNIIVATNIGISSTVGALNVTLNSDSDGVGGGSITLNAGSSISSLGGNIVMGGGADPSVNYATGNSVNVDGISLSATTSLNSGGGNISLLGKSFAGGLVQPYVGVWSNASIDSGTGTIKMDGISQGIQAVGSGSNSQGLILTGTISSANSTPTAITLTGSHTGSTGAQAIGVNIGGTIQATNGGGISISGTGGITTSPGAGLGLYIANTSILSNTGPITLSGTAGDGVSMDIQMNGASTIGQKALSPVTASFGNITLNADRLSLTPTDFLQSSGALSIRPRTAGTSIGIAGGAGSLQLSAANFAGNFVSGFADIIIGDGASGVITVAGATTSSDNLTLMSGSGININAPLSTAAGKTLTLASAGSVSGAGDLGASSLLLDGPASFSLNTSVNNAVGTLAVNATGGVSFTNSGALTIGTVGFASGIFANGAVSIETLAGDLTVSSDIAALGGLYLNAGKSAVAGAATGGNVLFSAPPGFAPPMLAIGIGTSATLMTGSVAGSLGVAAMAGPGNSRYNSDEAATNYTSAIGSGVFAVYREQPVVTVTANAAAKIYDGLAYLGGAGVTYGGFVNGDTTAQLGGALSYGGSSQNAVNAGGYQIVPAGLSNGVGYAISYVSGALNVTPAPLTVTANAFGKIYDGLAYTGGNGVSYTGLVNGQTGAVLTGAVSYSGTSQNAINAGNYVITPGGLSSGNYAISYVSGALNVTPAPLTVTANNISKNTGTAYSFTGTEFVSAGLKNGETVGSVSLSCAGAASTATVGSYAIVPAAATGGTFSAANYVISYVNGTMTLNSPVLTLPPVLPPPLVPVSFSPAPQLPVAAPPVVPVGGPSVPTVTSSPPPPVTQQPALPDIPHETPVDPVVITAPAAPVSVPVAKGDAAATGIKKGFVDNPAAAIDVQGGSRVQLALGMGLSPSVAQRIGNDYSTALTQQLSKGVTLSEALERADQVFAAQTSFPAAKSPQEALIKNLVASGNEVSSQLTTLAHAKTPSGSAAFDKVLASALVRGLNFAEAVEMAQVAVQRADALARADGSAQSMLANEASSAKLSGTSASYQKTLSALLMKGYTLDRAMQRAAQLAGEERVAIAAEARSPAISLASDKSAALDGHSERFDKVLNAALLRGLSPGEAFDLARQFEGRERVISPSADVASGKDLPVADPAFDQAWSNAILRGETPAKAMVSAQRAIISEGKPTLLGALATGRGLDPILKNTGFSRTFKKVFGNALARGVSAQQAVEIALRAEQANAYRRSLPIALARKMAGKSSVITMANGKPLPAWLHFDSAAKNFVSLDVPDGALPLSVVMRIGQEKYNFQITP